MDNDVQLKSLYGWVPSLAKTTPSSCRVLENRGTVYGFELTWGDESWSRKLKVKVKAEYGNCVDFDHAGRHYYILWVHGDGVETNQPDLVRVDGGGYYRLRIDWQPGNQTTDGPIDGLEQAIRNTYGL